MKQLPAWLSPATLLINFGELRRQCLTHRASWPRPHLVYVLSRQGPHIHLWKPEDDFSDEEIAVFEAEARWAQSLIAADCAIGARLEALRKIGVQVDEEIQTGRYALVYRFKLLADDSQIDALEALAANEAGYCSKIEMPLARLQYRMWLAQNYSKNYRFWRAAFPLQVLNPYRRKAVTV
jgi:hypothetical protein